MNRGSINRPDHDVRMMNMTNVISFQIKPFCSFSSHQFIKVITPVNPYKAVRAMTSVE